MIAIMEEDMLELMVLLIMMMVVNINKKDEGCMVVLFFELWERELLHVFFFFLFFSLSFSFT